MLEDALDVAAVAGTAVGGLVASVAATLAFLVIVITVSLVVLHRWTGTPVEQAARSIATVLRSLRKTER